MKVFFVKKDSLMNLFNLIILFSFCLNSAVAQSQNLALNKPATQISDYNSTLTASNAVDGDLSNDTRTLLNTNNPWWEVDLGSQVSITQIDIYNSSHPNFYPRLAGAKVYVGNNNTHDPADYVEVTNSPLTASTTVQQINFSSVTGRYVMVFLPKNYTSMHLAEVEVYGTTGTPPSGGSGLWTESPTNYDISYTAGNVGIGRTAITNYPLAVEGKIRAREVKVDNDTWADYVFEDDYNLPSLEEVAKHIAEKGHLINIPSAEEVKKNGIQLGEMNKLLLEKIEELTLYILQLEKRLLSMEKSNPSKKSEK